MKNKSNPIRKVSKLRAFLKRQNDGYTPKKSGGRQLGTLLYLGKICNKVQQAISAPVARG
jgi:hypothetical protein